MALNFRQSEILEIAKVEGRVAVEDLSRRFGVSVQTIRRDLSDLAEAGKLDRVHGGAVIPAGVTNIEYDQRRSMNHAAKADIARRCAQEIPDNSSVFLHIGTTAEAVARELLHHRNLTVMTSNLNAVTTLLSNDSCEIIVAGGALRRNDNALVGELTVRMVEEFKMDFAVIGTSALDQDGDLLDYDLQEVRVSRAIIGRSRRVLLVADQSKFERSAPARVASLREVWALVTDRAPEPQLARLCAEWGTRILLPGQERAEPAAPGNN